MTIAEHRQKLAEQFRAVKDRKEALEAELATIDINIEQIRGALYMLNELEKEQQQAQPTEKAPAK